MEIFDFCRDDGRPVDLTGTVTILLNEASGYVTGAGLRGTGDTVTYHVTATPRTRIYCLL